MTYSEYTKSFLIYYLYSSGKKVILGYPRSIESNILNDGHNYDVFRTYRRRTDLTENFSTNVSNEQHLLLNEEWHRCNVKKESLFSYYFYLLF